MAYSSIVAASKPLLLHQNPNLTNTSKPSLFPSPNSNSFSISLPSHLCFPSLKLKTPKSRVYATSSSSFPTTPSTLLSNSTRSISSIFSLALSISKIISTSIHQIPLNLGPILPTPDELASIQSMKQNLVCTMGPLFFAAMRPGSPRLNTPLTVVAAGMAKWLEIYGGLLMVRVLLSWFPNIPWDRQPLSAIRDLCDPYLNLFRNIIPPIFDTLDVSPLLAFAVMGIMGSILSSSSLA